MFAEFIGAQGRAYLMNAAVMLDGSADYFTRTPASVGNRKTWTFSCWIKLSDVSGSDTLCILNIRGNSGNDDFQIKIRSDWKLNIVQYTASVYDFGTSGKLSDALYRDPTSWGHLCVVADSTNSTAALRLAAYYNGEAVSLSGTDPGLNLDFHVNSAYPHVLGAAMNASSIPSSWWFDGYITGAVLVDGYALGPTSFGETDPVTGSWRPKRPNIANYGTNGFHLDFNDTANLGNDVSGNNNDLTPVSITSANAVSDTPTNNYATWNALRPPTSTLSNGNRTAAGTASATIPVSQSDKWYWEITAGATGVTAGLVNAAGTTYTASVGNGTTVSFRYTHSTTTLESSTDGSSWSTVSSSVSGTAFPYATGGSNTVNFGASAFLRTPTTGFKALCTDNMAATTGTSSGSFVGNASADGPFVWTGAPPATLSIDGSAVTWGTHADKTAGGFKIRTASSPYNDVATNNWTATYSSPQKPFIGSNGVPGTAQGNP